MPYHVLPASETKHLAIIPHPLPSSSIVVNLQQRSAAQFPVGNQSPDDRTLDESSTGSTGTTGTTLWLGAQVLACYLTANLPRGSYHDTKTPRHALELGSGTGYVSLVLASTGYKVTATDIEPVLSSVLGPNVESGLRIIRAESLNPTNIGNVEVRELDWTTCDRAISTLDESVVVDVIVMSDTIYHPSLNPALFDTLRLISQRSMEGNDANDRKYPTIYLALERRDSAAIDSALGMAADMGFNLNRVGHGRVVKVVKGAGWGWSQEGWEGVEVWKGRWAG